MPPFSDQKYKIVKQLRWQTKEERACFPVKIPRKRVPTARRLTMHHTHSLLVELHLHCWWTCIRTRHDAPSADIWISNEMSHHVQCSVFTGPKFGLMLELVYHWYWLSEMIRNDTSDASVHIHARDDVFPLTFSWNHSSWWTLCTTNVDASRLVYCRNKHIFILSLWVCECVRSSRPLMLSRRVDSVSTVEKLYRIPSVATGERMYVVSPEICFVWRTVYRCWVLTHFEKKKTKLLLRQPRARHNIWWPPITESRVVKRN